MLMHEYIYIGHLLTHKKYTHMDDIYLHTLLNAMHKIDLQNTLMEYTYEVNSYKCDVFSHVRYVHIHEVHSHGHQVYFHVPDVYSCA